MAAYYLLLVFLWTASFMRLYLLCLLTPSAVSTQTSGFSLLAKKYFVGLKKYSLNNKGKEARLEGITILVWSS